MKNLFNVVASLVVYYMAGWFLVYLVATLCGAPFNLSEWDEVGRVFAGLLVAPIVGLGIRAYIEDHQM